MKLQFKKWTDALALRGTNARLRLITKLAGEVGYLWGDVDEYAVGLANELGQRAEEVRLEIVASAQARVEDRETF